MDNELDKLSEDIRVKINSLNSVKERLELESKCIDINLYGELNNSISTLCKYPPYIHPLGKNNLYQLKFNICKVIDKLNLIIEAPKDDFQDIFFKEIIDILNQIVRLNEIRFVKNKTFYHISRYKVGDFKKGTNYNSKRKRDVLTNQTPAKAQTINKQNTENNLEKYRQINCPDYPSRKECLFVCEESDLNYWITNLDANKEKFIVYKMKCNGTALYRYYDDEMLVDETLIGEYWLSPYKYTKSPEILFSGYFTPIDYTMHNLS